MNTYVFAEPGEKAAIMQALKKQGIEQAVFCGDIIGENFGNFNFRKNRVVAASSKTKKISGWFEQMRPNLYLWTQDTLIKYGDYDEIEKQQKNALNKHDWRTVKNWNELNYSMNYMDKKTHLNSRPICLQIETGSFCNARCIMCDHHYKKNVGAKWLDRSMIKKLEPLLPYCKNIVLHGNGEPLLHPHIDEILEYYAKFGIRFLINSNFSYLPYFFLENAEKCFDTVNVSCDAADEDLYEKIRCGLNFNLFKDNVRIFRMKNPNLRMVMSSVLMRQNIEDILNQIRFAKNMGFDAIHFSMLGTDSVLQNHRDELSCYPDITKIYLDKAVNLAKQISIDIRIPECYLDYEEVSYARADEQKKQMQDLPFASWTGALETCGGKIVRAFPEKMLKAGKAAEEVKCRWPFRNMRIDLDGNIGICCRTSQYYVGRLSDNCNIIDVWNGDIYRKLRRVVYEGSCPHLCENCSYRNMCGG